VYWISWVFEFGTPLNHRREQVQLCPVNCMLGLAQPQLQKWVRCSTADFSYVYIQREAVTSSSCSQGLQCSPPSLRNASQPHVATVYNKLTGGGGGWCVSIQAHNLPGPSFMHVLSSVCCLFRHLLSLPVKVSRTSLCYEIQAWDYHWFNFIYYVYKEPKMIVGCRKHWYWHKHAVYFLHPRCL
jgi:hypothetical protein